MSLAAFLGEQDVTLNEHELAWRGREWDSVKKLADSFKGEEINEFFYVLNQINQGKSRVDTSDLESYSQFSVNNALSSHIDCMTHAFYMNLLGDCISDQMHYDYLMHSVRPSKRYGSAKAVQDPIELVVDKVFIKAVSRYYQVNVDRGREYVESHFDLDQIAHLKHILSSTIDEKFVKDTCPYVKKPDINKVLKSIESWSK